MDRPFATTRALRSAPQRDNLESMNLLPLAALLLAQDALEFPILEKDPWEGFGVGTTLVRVVTVAGKKVEETVTVKAAGAGGTVLSVAKAGEKAQEVSWSFVPFTERLLSDQSGFKVTSKSTKTVSLGTKKAKTLIREFAPQKLLGMERWRISTADEPVGGIADASFESETLEARQKLSWTCKGTEKLKVNGQDLECWRFDLDGSETGKKKQKMEGNYWLSAQVPGTVVRSRFKETADKVATETLIEVAKFEVKK